MTRFSNHQFSLIEAVLDFIFMLKVFLYIKTTLTLQYNLQYLLLRHPIKKKTFDLVNVFYTNKTVYLLTPCSIHQNMTLFFFILSIISTVNCPSMTHLKYYLTSPKYNTTVLSLPFLYIIYIILQYIKFILLINHFFLQNSTPLHPLIIIFEYHALF